MKRYLVALVVLLCVWAWCGDVTITDGGGVRAMPDDDHIINILEGADRNTLDAICAKDEEGRFRYILVDKKRRVVPARKPHEFEIIRTEMIAALKEAKEKLEAEGYIITGYEMNGASAKIHYYEPLTESEKEFNANPQIMGHFSPRQMSEVVYPPELVKMIEELE